MASYNAYIRTLATKKKAFFKEFQEIKFISEYLEAIAKIRSDFAWEIKERGN